jgi:hypothetical protein
LLEAEEQLRRDERAELELRQHVGELEGGEAAVAFKAVDDALTQLVGEKTGLSSRIAELDALLELKPFATPIGGAPIESPPMSIPRVPAAAPAPASAPPRAAAPISPPPPPAPPRPAAAHPPAAAPNAPAPAMSAAKTERAEPIIPSAEPAPPDRGGLRTPDGRFDEMAFVRGVVGNESPAGAAGPATAPAPPRARDVGSSNVPLRGRASQEQLVESVRIDPTRVERPLAANVPSNTPIVLRTSGQTEQSKTLKCSECGAMNYPTEWYCERCGAELAAL